MEILKNVSIDWLTKKWYFFGLSWALLGVGLAAYFLYGGFSLGIDFTGGTIIYLKFSERPDIDRIRGSLKPEAVGTTLIQRYDDPAKNTLLVRMQTVMGTEQDADSGFKAVQSLLRQAFDPEHVGSAKQDFNNSALEAVLSHLLSNDPEKLSSQNKTSQEIQAHYESVARSVMDFRDRRSDGLVSSLDDLAGAPGVGAAVVESLEQEFYAGPFAVKGVESVGAVVGADLRKRAGMAVLLSFAGMLVYIGFRFKPIYGVAAIVALFHDVGITLGLFALTQKEISLTVIAALLTLVGYSVNDTIVVFDRVRENLRLMHKEHLTHILNTSINQTLARTVMTSGMTFLAVVSLLIFGGEVLNGFAFALTIGIIVGTYSTIGIASPIVDWWYRGREQKKTKRKAA